MNVFKLHVIPPPRPLDWSSPRTLLRDTAFLQFSQARAPIGHFAIEIRADRVNRHGVSHVVTGMSRRNPNLSALRLMRERVGLGTLFFDFAGQLDHGTKSLRGFARFAARGRLRTISVPLSDETLALLWDELDAWIRHGSFRHYGSLDLLRGEGSGCAEFGAHFLNLSLGKRATPRAWIRSVHVPKALVGGRRTGGKVGLLRVYREGLAWASGEEDGFRYETPNMDLTTAWLEQHFPGQREVVLSAGDVRWNTEPLRRISFSMGYPEESEDTIRAQWKRIAIA